MGNSVVVCLLRAQATDFLGQLMQTRQWRKQCLITQWRRETLLRTRCRSSPRTERKWLCLFLFFHFKLAPAVTDDIE